MSSNQTVNSQTWANAQQQGFNGDVSAPVAGANAQQNNAPEGITVKTGYQGTTKLTVDRSTEDSRNFGQQLGNIGKGATVTIESTSDEIALGSIVAQHETSALALASNLESQRLALAAAQDLGGRAYDFAGDALTASVAGQRDALITAENLGGRSYDFAESMLERFDRVEDNRQQATLEVINSARQQTEEAGGRSEAIVTDALSKLAEQRAPDGAATAKTTLFLIGAAVIIALAWIFNRRPKHA